MPQADTPTRMSRQGAARAYHTYMNWGYFQRRMAAQPREPDGEEAPNGIGQDPQDPALTGADTSYAGAALPCSPFSDLAPDLGTVPTLFFMLRASILENFSRSHGVISL